MRTVQFEGFWASVIVLLAGYGALELVRHAINFFH